VGVLLCLLLFLTATAPPVPVPVPVDVAIRPGQGDTFTAVIEGPEPGTESGAFAGALALNGSAAELKVSGTAERAGGRLRIPLTLRYDAIPADWAERFRLDTFELHLRGSLSGREPLDWKSTLAWSAVSVEGDRDTAARFLKLGNVELTSFSLLESEAAAHVAVRNPFAFPLKVASATYRLFANGREVGSGETRGLLLHPKQENALDFPVEIDHAALLGAAGGALASGGEIEGRLNGALVVRLPGGDLPVPLDLSGRFALLSQ
jgi:LEA14-like dessication related protein